MIMNHPFIDGNKRIGALALLTMLDLNHIGINMSSKEQEDTILPILSTPKSLFFKAFED